jgi:hypothetical protein
MNRRNFLCVTTMTMWGVALLPGSGALAQQKPLKEQLVGTWTFVSATTKRPDGTPQWGSNPKGLTIFTADGHFTELIMRSDRQKFASNNRLQGTADDNKATVQGTISSFGTYTVDEARKRTHFESRVAHTQIGKAQR